MRNSRHEFFKQVIPTHAIPLAYSQYRHHQVLMELAGLTQLQWLDLTGTQVTDAGLKELTGLKQLQSLHLDWTKVTDTGLKELKEALPKCRIHR